MRHQLHSTCTQPNLGHLAARLVQHDAQRRRVLLVSLRLLPRLVQHDLDVAVQVAFLEVNLENQFYFS
jgi:hypothetical protein